MSIFIVWPSDVESTVACVKSLADSHEAFRARVAELEGALARRTARALRFEDEAARLRAVLAAARVLYADEPDAFNARGLGDAIAAYDASKEESDAG